ncbi:succinyl-diaminopimelate desuccinylase [Staphylococcus condimenti]|uniref:Probable succinyl-diaminopimelate desuccinylase n=1 Tax=Staphylococcus condimenti TaxID=70255 RepID=A0AB37H1M0_9STAP|nr:MULTISPECIES: ArgE/DapE family deacylase [Staphylococcus]AMY05795.1 succinyl-diaminopimelate desuccinylase [Staphylococcus condimenti]APR62000.1 succinyl-diaminopimelate desuccinylase [Staphylococcus condimenti]MDK8645384.1 ArgE/DapE family deacylase [Staphylococcus condimenti]OFP04084.1 succinyl-diaminopimelate desuccinylase [Staphylococcus sp. HMSC065E08]PNZ62812.1 succinyl-diaminopimelate desuccinylase [Staphylococcus condimenti]
MGKLSSEEKVEILADIVGIESVNDNELEVANYLHDLLQKHHIDSKVIKLTDTRANLVAEIGNGSPVLAVSGHMDVVSPGDPSKWQTPPFKLTEDEEGRLHGRGTSDMKSGLAAFVISMIELHEQGLPKNGTVRLLATAGEEIEGHGAKAFYKDGYMDDVDALVIAEPSKDKIIYAHKGSMDIRVTSNGKSVHSSMPSLGYNAINPLVDFVNRINQAYNSITENNDLLGDSVVSATIFNGGSQVNSIPDYAEAEFNVRTIPEADNDSYQKLFEQIAKNVKVDAPDSDLNIDTYMSRPPVFTKGDNRLVDIAQSLSKKYLGKEVPKKASPGVTDASDLVVDKGEDFSFIMFGPGETSQAHVIDEYVNKEDYLNFIDLFEDLLTEYLDYNK